MTAPPAPDGGPGQPAAGRAYLSIGEVLGLLRPDFPDVSISKIRFLEGEGLVEPERSPSGYRRFTRRDVGRLRYVLAAQRDQYLPLRVIREHLDAIDRGLQPPQGAGAPQVPEAVTATEGLPGPEAFAPAPSEVRLSRAELIAAAGLSADQVADLEQYGLLAPVAGSSLYDGDALVVGKTVAELARFGIGARHLRPFTMAAEREVGLVQQVLAPLSRQRDADAHRRADEVSREIAALSVRLHATLVRVGLRRSAGRLVAPPPPG